MSLNVTNMFAGCTSIAEEVPAVLFTTMPESMKANGLICVQMFDGCTGVTGIEAGVTEAIPNVEGTNMTAMFRNCTAITGALPEMWKTLTATVHTDCFKGCTAASNWMAVPPDWGGESNYLELVVKMPEGRLKLDLTTALWTGNVCDLVTDTAVKAVIAWGDGQVTNAGDASDKTKLAHTYAKAGTYTIKLVGVLRWFTANSDTANPSGTSVDLAAFLTGVKVTGKCPIRQFCGAFANVATGNNGYAFAHCQQLTSVSGDVTNGLVESETNKSSFGRMFWGTALSAMPKMTVPAAMTDLDFRGMYNSTKVTAVDMTLFNALPAKTVAMNCHDMFSNCAALTSIPEALFDKLPTTVTTLNCGEMFSATHLTAIPAKLLAKVPNTNTVELGTMFRNVTTLTAAVPNFWSTHGKTKHANCFQGCVNASNYVGLPLDWGGPTVFELVIDQSKSAPGEMVAYAGANAKAVPMKMNFSSGAIEYGSWKDSWLLSRFRPCLLNLDGTVKYYLKKEDLTKKADGSDASADLKNTAGSWNAMVEVGQVWVKEVNEDGKFHIYLSSAKADGYDCWTHYNAKNKLLDKIYVPMYKGSKDSAGKMRSLSGQAPNVSEAGNLQRGYCQANGTGWDAGEWSFRRLIQYVVTLLGRSTDSQTAFGNGIEAGATNKPTAAVKTGGTEAKGWFYGVNNDYSAHVRVLGIEDLWGNVWDFTNGLMIHTGDLCVKMTPGTADGTTGTSYDYEKTGYYTVGKPDLIHAESWPLDPEATEGPGMQEEGGRIGADGVFRPVALTPESGNGQIAGMQLVPGKGLFPASTETTMGTHYCDHVWWNFNASGTYIARVGGSWAHAAGNAGVFAVALNRTRGNVGTHYGAGPAFKGE